MVGTLNIDSAIQDISATGYVAAFATIFAFYSTNIRKMRISAIIANSMFILYGIINSLPPIYILHMILLPINILRLIQIYSLAYKQNQITL